MNGLLDTAILVDLLRGYPPATSWLKGQPQLGVSPVVWLEILDGVTNRTDQERAVKLLGHFLRTEVLPNDFDWAIRLPLFTRNLKHFQPLIGSLAQRPY